MIGGMNRWVAAAVTIAAAAAVASCAHPRPTPPPTPTVTAVYSATDVGLSDGRTVHVPSLGAAAAGTCDAQADNELAGRLLLAQPAALHRDLGSSHDSDAPAGAEQADIVTPAGSYTTTFTKAVFAERAQKCPIVPADLPAATPGDAESAGSGDVDTHVHHGGDHVRVCVGGRHVKVCG